MTASSRRFDHRAAEMDERKTRCCFNWSLATDWIVISEKAPNWLDNLLRGAASPKPPAIDSMRVKDLAGRGLLTPRSLSEADIQELSAAVISHLVARRH